MPQGRPGLVVNLYHVAVCVTEIERARRFYGGVLGLIEVPRPDFDFEGAWYQMPGGGQVHLIVHERPRTLRGTRELDARDGHVALRVRSYHEKVTD